MRKTLMLIVALLGVAVQAAEKPPEDYKNAMRDLRRFAEEMGKPEAETNFELATKYVPIVRDAFGVVAKYWMDRHDGGKYALEITTAQDGTKVASDMGVAATLRSPEGVAAAVKDILGRCQSCHEARREQAPDGSYLIR